MELHSLYHICITFNKMELQCRSLIRFLRIFWAPSQPTSQFQHLSLCNLFGKQQSPDFISLSQLHLQLYHGRWSWKVIQGQSLTRQTFHTIGRSCAGFWNFSDALQRIPNLKSYKTLHQTCFTSSRLWLVKSTPSAYFWEAMRNPPANIFSA